MRSSLIAYLSVFVAASVVNYSRGFAGDAQIQRFKREYPNAASRIQEAYSRAKGRCVVTERREPNSDRVTLTEQFEFAADHGYRKFASHGQRTGWTRPLQETIYCVGKDSAFALGRRTSESPYRVTRTGSDRTRIEAIYNTCLGRYVEAAYFVCVAPLSEFMKMAGFRVISAEEVVVTGRSMLRLECECDDGNARPKTKLRVDLEPDSGWRIHSAEWRPGALNGAWMAFQVEYGPSVEGVPVPRRVDYRDISGFRDEALLESIAFSTTPEREFTMGFYGLPDLSLTKPRARSELSGGWIPWLLAMAGVALIGAVGIRFMARRWR